jgi:tryptophan halogenase
LIQSGIAKLLALFPSRACDVSAAEQYNRILAQEFEAVRDFLVLHYHSTRGRAEPPWEYCRAMPLPESLIYREEHFCRSARIFLSSDELFKDPSWFAVLVGQGHQPKDYNPLIDSITSEENGTHLRRVKDEIRQAVARMPDHVASLP